MDILDKPLVIIFDETQYVIYGYDAYGGKTEVVTNRQHLCNLNFFDAVITLFGEGQEVEIKNTSGGVARYWLVTIDDYNHTLTNKEEITHG